MDDDNMAETHDPAGQGRPDPGRAVLAVPGVIAAVSGTYASTHSLAVTIVAGCVGLVCAALIAWKR